MSILQLKSIKSDQSFRSDWLKPAPIDIDPQTKRRAKIWDISPTFHCSIVGTCLTAAQLRQLFVRLGDDDARTASDHTLHSRGVGAALHQDLAGKQLNKTLDRLHETAIKRFSKANSADELRTLWNLALDQGEISGAYWAVMTHPSRDRALVQEVFGEVHMLSHMVGSSNRLDLARLRRLEIDLGDRDETILRQQVRLQQAAMERDGFFRRINELEAVAARRIVVTAVSAAETLDSASMLREKLETEKAHSSSLQSRLDDVEEKLREAQKRVAGLQSRESALQAEVLVLERELRNANVETDDHALADLDGRTLLYVGGRPGLVDQLRTHVSQHGGTLLCHDGGVEDNLALIAGLLSRADTAFFPVDCVSHRAVGQIKKFCTDAGKPFVALRTASVASFIAAIAARSKVERDLPSLSTAPRF